MTKKRSKPKKMDHYWKFSSNGDVSSFKKDKIWMGDASDISRWKFGNCFKTKTEAIAAAKAVKKLLLSLHGEGK